MELASAQTRCRTALKRRFRNIPLSRRLFGGAAWSLAGTLTARISNLVAAILMARLVGRSDYGEFGTILATVTTFQLFATMGLGVTAVKFVAEHRGSNPAQTGKVLGLALAVSCVMGAVVGLLLLVCAPVVARDILGAPRVEGLLRVAALGVFFSSITSVQAGALSGFEAFRSLAGITAVNSVLNLGLTLCGGVLFGVHGAVWGFTAASAILLLQNTRTLRRCCREEGISLKLPRSFVDYHLLFRFSLPAMMSSLLQQPINWAAAAILIRKSGFAEAAILNATYQWFSAILLIPSVLGNALLPILSDRIGKLEYDSAAKVLRSALLLVTAVVAPTALIGSLASPWIMHLYGAEFAGAGPSLAIALCTAALMGISFPLWDTLSALGWTWIGVPVNALWAALYLAGCTVMADGGALGVVSARLFAYVVQVSLLLFFTRLAWTRGRVPCRDRVSLRFP